MFLLTYLSPNNQQGECLCWFPGPVGSHRHFPSWKDPNSEDILDPNFPGPFMAEDTRVRCYGLVPGL
jgi:hypothetical protein